MKHYKDLLKTVLKKCNINPQTWRTLLALPERCTEVGGGEEHKETAKTAQEANNHACPSSTQTAYSPSAMQFVDLRLDSTVKEFTVNSEVDVIIRYDGLP